MKSENKTYNLRLIINPLCSSKHDFIHLELTMNFIYLRQKVVSIKLRRSCCGFSGHIFFIFASAPVQQTYFGQTRVGKVISLYLQPAHFILLHFEIAFLVFSHFSLFYVLADIVFYSFIYFHYFLQHIHRLILVHEIGGLFVFLFIFLLVFVKIIPEAIHLFIICQLFAFLSFYFLSALTQYFLWTFYFRYFLFLFFLRVFIYEVKNSSFITIISIPILKITWFLVDIQGIFTSSKIVLPRVQTALALFWSGLVIFLGIELVYVRSFWLNF